MRSLIIGGACQGKLEFAKNKFNLKENDIVNLENERYNNQKCVYNLHCYIKDCIYNKVSYNGTIKQIISNDNIIIICNEIGCGIVPIDKNERLCRDIFGKICCDIAKSCDTVIRVYCGIGEVIK